jgi:uncharacterized membrane protein
MSTTLGFSLLFVLTTLGVLWGMLSNHRRIPAWVNRHDKLMHFAAFALLAALAQAAWPSLSWWWLWLSLTLMGLLGEGLQHCLAANRRFCWRDALANALGAASMLAFWHSLI